LKKKILITGGSGYLAGSISSFLCQNKNYEVSICSSSNIESKHGEIKTLRVDWNKKSSLINICKGKDIIIHCASPDANFSKKNPDASYEFSNNILDSFLDEAIHNKVKKFIYFSSAHVYQPKLEGVLNEKSPIIPEHPYGVSKKIAEQTLLKKKELIEINIVRLSNAFGIPSNKNLNCWKLVVNDFCKQAILDKKILINSDGTQVRNFVSIHEVCRLIDFMIKYFFKGKLLPNIFNFGGNWTLSIFDMAKLIAKQYEKHFDLGLNILIKKSPKLSSPKLNFNYDLIIKSGFKPNNNNLAHIDELFLYVRNNFNDVR
jgi:UDP-glucose 4-epimerase